MLYDLFEFRQHCKYSALLFAWYPVDHPGPVRIVVRVCLFTFCECVLGVLKKKINHRDMMLIFLSTTPWYNIYV